MDNRGCGGGAVCLVETGVRGACVCPPLQASTIKTDSDGINRITCAGERSNVLLEERGKDWERKWIYKSGDMCIV